MIREHLFGRKVTADEMFRWRGGDVSRLEGLSDGVFAVTLTLLIVSQSVPNTFYDLWLVIRNLPVFFVCFALLMMAWRYHYMFFRRYGLEDFITSVLNAAFLFLVLFYAYPLKFLATFLWTTVIGESTRPMFAVPEGVQWVGGMFQRGGLMYFFSGGFIGVFGVLCLMEFRAFCLRQQLELDELERYLNRASIRTHLSSVGVGFLSIIVLMLAGQPGWAGICFFLMAPIHTWLGFMHGFGADKIFAKMKEQNSS